MIYSVGTTPTILDFLSNEFRAIWVYFNDKTWYKKNSIPRIAPLTTTITAKTGKDSTWQVTVADTYTIGAGDIGTITDAGTTYQVTIVEVISSTELLINVDLDLDSVTSPQIVFLADSPRVEGEQIAIEVEKKDIHYFIGESDTTIFTSLKKKS